MGKARGNPGHRTIYVGTNTTLCVTKGTGAVRSNIGVTRGLVSDNTTTTGLTRFVGLDGRV